MPIVAQLLESKPSDVWVVDPSISVYDAIQMMAEKGIGAVIVLDQGQLVGILSERDYARKVILCGRSSRDTLVGDIMSQPVVCVRPEQGLEECMVIMTEQHIRHLPVLEGDTLIGMISIEDVVRAVISG